MIAVQKFLRYRTWLLSLTDYVLVSQNQPLVELFSSHENGEWGIIAPVGDLQGSIAISSIGCVLPLAEVYDGVAFPPPPND